MGIIIVFVCMLQILLLISAILLITKLAEIVKEKQPIQPISYTMTNDPILETYVQELASNYVVGYYTNYGFFCRLHSIHLRHGLMYYVENGKTKSVIDLLTHARRPRWIYHIYLQKEPWDTILVKDYFEQRYGIHIL